MCAMSLYVFVVEGGNETYVSVIRVILFYYAFNFMVIKLTNNVLSSVLKMV